MLQATLRLVTLTMAFTGSLACAKSKSDVFYEDGRSSLPDIDAVPSAPNAIADNDLQRALNSAGALLDEGRFPDEPPAENACPGTKDWQKFDAFGASCGYVWTTDADKLPPALQWRSCARTDGVASALCRQSTRGRRIKSFSVGTTPSKEMVVGFVEACATDQLVLTDTEGKPLFALRRADDAAPSETCQFKLLDVDLGQWLAAVGSSDRPKDLDTPGYSLGGAFVGGAVGAAPSVLFSTTSEPFHVATSHGDILVDGFSADGRRRDWKGKPLGKPPKIGLQRVTKNLFVDPRKGFYSTMGKEPELLWEVPKGHTVNDVLVRDLEILWRDESTERGRKQCTLFGGNLDARETLTGARPIAEMPCSSANVAYGCSSVLIEYETHLALVSPATGSARVLRMKGHPAAVHCKVVFVERGGTLMRIDTAAFGAAKIALPPADESPAPRK